MMTATPENRRHNEVIHGLYDTFRAALINRDGKTAAPLLSGETLNHYGSLRDIACKKNSPARLGPLERLTILSMQRRLSAALLVGGTDIEIMIALIDEGIFGAEIADLDLNEIDIVFPEAYGVLSVDNQPLSLRLPFLWEKTAFIAEETWRIHWLSFLPAIRMSLKGILVSSGKDENTILTQLVDWRNDKAKSKKKSQARSLYSGESCHGRNSL